MKYTIIAPAYNEEGNVQPLIEKIEAAMKPTGAEYEIMIVDDGSTDGTLKRLKELAETHTNLTVVSLMENSGQTVAFQAGFDNAEGERVITIDSDLEKDPAYIPQMIEKMEKENLDLVYFRKLYKKDIPFKRRFGSYIANRFRNFVTGDKAVDVGSTFKLYRKNIFKGRNFGSGFHRYFIGFMEAEGLSMGYIEGDVFNRPTGETKYTNLGRLKQGLYDLFYFYLYKNKFVGVHKLIFVMTALLIVFIIWPVNPYLRTFVFVSYALFAALIMSFSIHSLHLMIQRQKTPYQIKEIIKAGTVEHC